MSNSYKIVILVSQAYYESNHVDDLVLKEALELKGVAVDIVNWDHSEYDFSKADAAIIRSCWDYDQRVEEFINTIEQINTVCPIINPFSTVKENCNKLYLSRLKERGVPIVPTEYIHRKEDAQDILNRCPYERIIIKPTVSASGRNTYRRNVNDSDILDIVDSILEHSEVMIQPYMDSVENRGEKSTVVINGEVVFTMLKTPAEGNFLVHNHKGGIYTENHVSEKDIPFIKQVIESLPDKTAYVRIDYLFDKTDTPLLLELEMIEPNLYLHKNPNGVQLLCGHILEILS